MISWPGLKTTHAELPRLLNIGAGLYENLRIAVTMASQPLSSTSEDLHHIEIQSFLRGNHAYGHLDSSDWPNTAESTNPKDNNAVAVYEEDSTGHVPYNLAPYLSQFLARDVNKAFAEVTGEKVNRGAGYRLEIPCVYRVYGPKTDVNKLIELTDSLKPAGHIRK